MATAPSRRRRNPTQDIKDSKDSDIAIGGASHKRKQRRRFAEDRITSGSTRRFNLSSEESPRYKSPVDRTQPNSEKEDQPV